MDVALRTQHVDYLEYLAERDGITLSHAFSLVLEAFKIAARTRRKPPNKRADKHFSLGDEHHAFLQRLSVDWGVSQSEVARRLIDGAIQQDPDISG